MYVLKIKCFKRKKPPTGGFLYAVVPPRIELEGITPLITLNYATGLNSTSPRVTTLHSCKAC